MALSLSLVALFAMLFVLKLEYSQKKSIQLDGVVYYYYGPLDIRNNCVSFLDAETQNYRTICTTATPNIVISK
jgi:hypothetical protein